MCSRQSTLQVWPMRAPSALHTSVSSNLHGLPEINCSHCSSIVRVGHQFSVIVPNAKDEAWSQHKRLYGNDDLNERIEDHSTQWNVVRKLRREGGEAKARNSKKASEIKDMSSDQYRETVPNYPSCWRLSQFTDVYHRNPDCKTQREDLPCTEQYPTDLR